MAADDSYLAKNKLTPVPGFQAGTLAKDMGNQGPVYDRSGSSLELGENMHMPGKHGGKMKQPVTAKLRELMRQ